MTVRSWQIQLKPGEWPPEEDGRWLASVSEDNHIIGITRRSHPTQEAAEAACKGHSDDDDDEVFAPLKGYPSGREPTTDEEARDAYYQGFITGYEYVALRNGKAVIDRESKLVWFYTERSSRLLNRSRMLEIQTDHLFGIGDGTTTRD